MTVLSTAGSKDIATLARRLIQGLGNGAGQANQIGKCVAPIAIKKAANNEHKNPITDNKLGLILCLIKNSTGPSINLSKASLWRSRLFFPSNSFNSFLHPLIRKNELL